MQNAELKSLLEQFKDLELSPEETTQLKGGDGDDGGNEGVVIEDQVIF